MKKRILSMILALVMVLGMLPMFDAEADAYYGNEMMTSGDADVAEAIMANMLEFSYKLAENKGDISFLYDSPAAAFVDETVRSLIKGIPGYGEDLEKVYNGSMLLFEASWELGEALAQVGPARRDLMNASLGMAAEHQEALLGIVSIAYKTGMYNYQNGTILTDSEIKAKFSTANSTGDTVARLRKNADHKIFLFDKKSAEKIDKAADRLEVLEKVIMEPLEAYHLGWDVAEAWAKANTVEPDNNSNVDARLKQLCKKLVGKYFTTTGVSCGNNNCNSCGMVNVIKTDYFRSLVGGFVPDSSVTNAGIYHNFGAGNKYTNGWSCCGFANFAAWYIFAESTSDKVTFNCVCPGGTPVSFTEAGLKSTGIKPGDVLRVSNHPTKGANGHSAIFIEFAENGIRVLDSNSGQESYGKNYVRTHVLSYSAYSYACVSRADNYNEVNGLPDGEYLPTPDSNTKTQYRYHMYVNENGVRSVCPYSGASNHPGTTFTVEYSAWLDEPLTVDNGEYSGYRHVRQSACASYGCADESYSGNRHRDAEGKTWFYEETRTVPKDCTHSWDAGTVTIAATCTDDGERTYLCTICGESRKETVAATGHSYGEWLEIAAPTENEAGEEQRICANCGDSESRELPALGHITHKYTNTVTAPTCTEQGYTTYTCACGDSYKDDYTKALGHEWVDGKVTKEPTEEAEGEKTFTCTVCGETRTEAIAKLEPVVNPFNDIAEEDYYFAPVMWAVQKGVTSGLSADSFGPAEGCTRAQVVTFLWRAAGKPAPKSGENPFKDVAEGQYYYNAVLWAVENGITSGLSADSFGPDANCNRGQIVTFLWRAAGEPTPTSDANPFKDVDKAMYYYDAVLWAVENGITSGVSADSFAPDTTCTRGQIVTFLYRNDK